MGWTPLLCCVVLVATGGCRAQSSSDSNDESSIRTETTIGETSSREPGPRAAPPADEPRGTENWRMTRFAKDGQIEGYPSAASGPPGTQLDLKVSTTEGKYKVLAYRIGGYERGTGHLVWESRYLPGELQAEAVFEPQETRTVVAPWHQSLSVDTTSWGPGFYIFRLHSASGWEYQIPYVVSSPSAADTVALVVPVTTWQAYNLWGGYSLYDGPDGDRRSWAVSFDRPYRGVGGMNDLHTAVIPIVLQAERTGVPLSYFANVELDEDPDRLAGARGYVSMGHDEYWTLGIRRAVLAARDAGTNLAFLGANTMYWRVRLESRPTGPARLMIGYKTESYLDPEQHQDPERTTARFRDEPRPMPENGVTGMLYECFPVNADYTVMTPKWWGFKGTNVRHGTTIPGLVGGESDRVYPNAATPRPLQILSHVAIDCRGTTTTSQSVYYTVASGAGVFNAGTLRWGCALVDLCDRSLGPRTRDFARRVTDNLLRGFVAGPVGLRHPARDNVADFDLPLLNGVTAS